MHRRTDAPPPTHPVRLPCTQVMDTLRSLPLLPLTDGSFVAASSAASPSLQSEFTSGPTAPAPASIFFVPLERLASPGAGESVAEAVAAAGLGRLDELVGLRFLSPAFAQAFDAPAEAPMCPTSREAQADAAAGSADVETLAMRAPGFWTSRLKVSERTGHALSRWAWHALLASSRTPPC